MKWIKIVIVAFLTIATKSMMAQTNNEVKVKKEAGKARITVVHGQDHLVLV